MRRPWRAALLWGGMTVGSVLCLLLGAMLGHATLYAPVLVQSAFVLWAGGWMFLGFRRQRITYRERYGTLAYRQLFFRFLVPFVVVGAAAAVFPSLVGGPPLLPRVLAYGASAYLLVTMALLELRGEEIFWDIEWRAFVYNVFPERGRLVTSGLFSWVRHPIYSAAIRFALGLALVRNNVPALLCALLVAMGVWLLGAAEERDLRERDPQYAAYRAAVPAFFATHPVRFWRYLLTGHAE